MAAFIVSLLGEPEFGQRPIEISIWPDLTIIHLMQITQINNQDRTRKESDFHYPDWKH